MCDYARVINFCNNNNNIIIIIIISSSNIITIIIIIIIIRGERRGYRVVSLDSTGMISY